MDLYGRETSSRSNQPRGRGSKAKPASTAAMTETDAKEEPPKPILGRLVKDKLVLFVVVGAGEGDGGGHELTPVVMSGAGEGGGRRSPGQGRHGCLRREHPHLHPQPLSHMTCASKERCERFEFPVCTAPDDCIGRSANASWSKRRKLDKEAGPQEQNGAADEANADED